MQCVILAGGLGTRMKSVSGDLPKALLPVGEQTFVDLQLQWLKLLGISRAIMALGYGGEEIRTHIEARRGNGLYPEMEYRFDGKEFLGTGGAIKNAQDLLENDFLVTYGDSFLLLDAAALFESHRRGKYGATMSIYRNKGSGDTSNVLYAGGVIKAYDKINLTPAMEHIDYGMSVLQKNYFLEHATAQKFDLASLLGQACSDGRLGAYEAREMFFEVGSPAGYQRFVEFMAQNNYDLPKLKKELKP